MPRHITNITLFHEMPTQLRGRRGKDMLRIAANKLTAVLSGVERGTSCIVQASTSALTVSATSGAAARASSMAASSGPSSRPPGPPRAAATSSGEPPPARPPSLT